MPIYEYSCESCGNTVDVMQKVNDPGPAQCQSCGKQGTMKRVVSRTSFVLKGGGWYSDLYSSVKKSDSKSEGKSESKSESKSDSSKSSESKAA